MSILFCSIYQDKHWTSVMATKNRIPCNSHSSENDRNLADLDNNVLLPQENDHVEQRKDYVALVGRILTKCFPCLAFLSNVAVNHIKHQYYTETSKPTETVFFFCHLFFLNIFFISFLLFSIVRAVCTSLRRVSF